MLSLDWSHCKKAQQTREYKIPTLNNIAICNHQETDRSKVHFNACTFEVIVDPYHMLVLYIKLYKTNNYNKAKNKQQQQQQMAITNQHYYITLYT